MGRWTPRYHDEVLITKIENIVAGVVQRLEDQEEGKTKLHISYENFVQSIEEGDPFTTSLIEILVKELADRQTRSNTSDRESINVRTVQELNRLAGETPAYRQAPYNRARNRSNYHVAGATTDGGSYSWLAPNPRNSYDSMEEDDTDDVTVNEHFVSMEGTRLDSAHLYDVYRQPNPISNSRSRQAFHALRRQGENVNNGGPLLGFPTIQGTVSTVGPSGSSLPSVSSSSSGRPVPLSRAPTSSLIARQRAIRRARPQTSEFSDFSARRRNAQRSSTNEDPRTQDPLSSSSLGTTMLAPVRSPLQTVPPIIPPPPSSSTSPISPASPHAAPDVPQVIIQHGSASPPLDRIPHGAMSSADGDAAPGSNVFYSTALSNSLTRANSFADRRLPVPRFFHNYVPPPEIPPHRPQFRGMSPSLQISGVDDFSQMFRDDFERDFGAWFSSADDMPTHTASTSPAEVSNERIGAASTVTTTTRETSEPAANLPTPRSVSPTENP